MAKVLTLFDVVLLVTTPTAALEAETFVVNSLDLYWLTILTSMFANLQPISFLNVPCLSIPASHGVLVTSRPKKDGSKSRCMIGIHVILEKY